MGRFKPGESVPRTGVYRVNHDLHRLMHQAALIEGELFPSCRQCNNSVRFELVRPMRDGDVLPSHSGEILTEYRGKVRRIS
jgi:hypothetical protein